ncbi:hypothetical protein AGMMS50256_22160 [Betaproteobacteria bacterium]|nr:hypothetical protein AGMMS50256_22160 [Betaproteobacteria bacterium]
MNAQSSKSETLSSKLNALSGKLESLSGIHTDAIQPFAAQINSDFNLIESDGIRLPG